MVSRSFQAVHGAESIPQSPDSTQSLHNIKIEHLKVKVKAVFEQLLGQFPVSVSNQAEQGLNQWQKNSHM